MAAKRKASSSSSLPPPRSPSSSSSSSSSSSDGSSSEEEQAHATLLSLAKNPPRTENAIKKDPEPPKATPKAPLKPSKSNSPSDESEEESEGTEKPKATVDKSESKPDKKKLKVSAPDQSASASVKSSSAFLRIWSDEDEMAILKALTEYLARNGHLPQAKDYAAFLSTVSGSIGFPVTEKQLANKIQLFKRSYDKKIKKGSHANLSKPHDKAVFKMCAKLFEGRSSKAVSEKKVKLESSGVVKTESRGATNGGVADSGVADGAGTSRSCNYLRGFIEELIKEQQFPDTLGLSTVEDAIALIGEPMAKKFEPKVKTLKIDMTKLLARKQAIRAKLFGIIADELADD